MKLHFWEPPDNLNINEIDDACIAEITEQDGRIDTNLSMVKKLLKKYGGYGYTEHYERDGSMFEVTEITVKGNNSNHKYNHHL